MILLGFALMAVPAAAFAWAYVAYPALLWIVARGRRLEPVAEPDAWPQVSISLPAYNEESQISGALDALLALDYPRDRLQILVVSDGSTDRTDEIVGSYADRGVELLRVEGRAGKTAAENRAASHLRGEIVVNTDASIRLRPESVKALVRALEDPGVGVASGRDVSVASVEDANLGEGGYVGYEMWVRSLESATGSIVGASGCFYATRHHLHLPPEPPELSRDFASVLRAREAGFRSVHVPEAVCLVPRGGSLRQEMRRKSRTMARGLATLKHHRPLLNPLRHGSFAIKLFSHKLCRWLVFLLAPLGLVGLAVLSVVSASARFAFAAVMVVGLVAWLRLQRGRGFGRAGQLAAFGLASFIAGFRAWWHLFTSRRTAVWEPTRRDAETGTGSHPAGHG